MRWLLVLALVAGCKDKAKPDEAKPQTVEDLAGGDKVVGVTACDARVKRLAERLGALAKSQPGMLPVVADAALPSSPAGKPIDAPGVVVTVTKDDKVIVAGNTATLAEGERLVEEAFWRRAAEAAAMDRGPKKPWPLYVWADKDAKAASLAKLFSNKALMKDFSLRLLVAGDPPSTDDAELLAKPNVKKLVEGMPKTEDEALTYRAKHMRDAAGTCATLPMAFATAMDAGPIGELAQMAERIPKAVGECNCAMIDYDVFEYSVLHVFGAFHPRTKWIEMPALAAGDKRTVAELAR